MKILICGATGFVGRHLATSLRANGHTVFCGVRNPSQPDDIAVDFTRDTTKEAWLPKLVGIDAVINAVGVLRESKRQPMALLHEKTPIALFSACQEAGVKRIVQITALGIDHGIETIYFQSRRAPEAYLKTLPDTCRYLILRPSLVFGDDGIRSKMFKYLAELPVHLLMAGGKQQLQPVHIEEICEALNHWLTNPKAKNLTVECVGAESTDMRGMLDSYREQLKYKNALHINIPAFLVRLSARIGDFVPSSPLCSDTLTILNAGNTGDASEFTKLLGRSPRSYRTFLQS